MREKLRTVQRQLERHKFVADHTSDAVYWVREDSSFFYVNQAACKMLGYDRDDLLTLSVVDIDPDYPADVWARHWERMKRDRSLTVTTQHRVSDGSTRTVLMQVHFYEFDGEEFIVGTGSDVSRIEQLERKHDELAAANQSLINLLSQSDGVFDWNYSAGSFWYAEGFRNVLGYRGDDLAAVPNEMSAFTSIIHPHDRAHSFEPALERMQRRGESAAGLKVELRVRNRSGVFIWLRCRAKPAYSSDGKISRLVGTIYDITERKEAELSLAESERRFRELADISTPCWITEADSTCSWLNRAWVEYTGVSLEEQLGFGWTEAVHPEDRDASRETYLAAVEAQTDFTLEYRLRRHDGEYRLHQAVGRVRLDNDRRFNGFSGFSVDVHDQRDIERRLRQEQEALKRSNEDLQQFASIASHDLQEPLRKITAYAQLVLEELDTTLEAEHRHYLEVVVDGAARLTRLVRELLAYSRITTHARTSTSVDVVAAASRALANLEIMISEVDARIEIGNLPNVMAETSQVETLIQNLVSNALRYRSNAPARVEIGHAKSVDGYEELFVRDNGIGIAPEYHERIFDVFRRLHGKSEYGSGSGIGLANCKRIVERFGGRLWVQSSEGEGSCFFFTLPQTSLRE